jgi:hypothetical protein
MLTYSAKFVDERSSDSKNGASICYTRNTWYSLCEFQVATKKYFKNCKIQIFTWKICQEMWGVGTCGFYKFQSHTQLHEIHGNQVINAYAISTGHRKFLVAFRNENLFAKPAAKGYFSGYVSLPKNFSTSQAAIFASPIGIEKLINVEGLFLMKLRRAAIQNQKRCCTFQMALVYNRVCWGFIWCGFGLFSFEKCASGP